MRFSIPLWAAYRGGRRALAIVVMSAAGAWLCCAPVSAQTAADRFESLRVVHVDVESARQRLAQALGSTVQLVADPANGRLLIAGSDDARRIAANLLAEIDRPTGAAAVPTPAAGSPLAARTVGTNTDLAPNPQFRLADPRTTSVYAVAKENQGQVAAYLESLYRPDAGLSIAVDAARNEMIIVAPQTIQAEVGEIMASRGIAKAGSTRAALDTSPISQSLALRNIDWRQFESVLVATWGNRLSVQSLMNGQRVRVSLPHTGSEQVAPVALLIDRATNQVSLDGAASLVNAWMRAIERIDVPAGQATETTSWITVSRPADPDLRQALSFLRLSGSATPIGAAANRAATNPTPRTRNVSLMLQDQGGAAPAAPAVAPQDPQGPQTPLADENGVISGLSDEQGPIGPVRLEFIEELGIVVVTGDPNDVARVKKLIQEIEQVANTTVPKVEMVELKSVDSQAVATIVQNLYDTVYATRQGTITVTPLVKPNAVLVVGSEEAVAFAMELIKQLDIDAPAESEFRVFRLKYMSSEDMKARINELYLGLSSTGFGAGGITQGERPGLGTRVRVVSDYRSNSLVITASPRDLEEIGRLIQELDTVSSQASNAVKVFRLKNALAEQLQPVLQDALNGQLQGAGIGANPGGTGLQGQNNLLGGVGQQQLARLRSAMLALRMIDADGKTIEGGIMYDVRVTADINSNSLVVTGPEENMSLIQALIDSLDQLPEVETKIKVFPVTNNDSGVLLQLLTDLFSTQQQGGGGGQQGGLSNLPLQSGIGGDSTLVGLRFGADPRTNSIIASGSEMNLRVVEDLIYRLDQDDLHQRINKVFRLRNTTSTSVQTAIQGWIDARATLYGDGQDAVGVPFDREVIVVDEPEGNSLIISVTPQYFDEIDRIIQELDRRPMIMVRALIAEVTLGDNEQFGFEAGVQDSLLFDRGLGTIGFPFNQAGLGNTNVGREQLAGQGLSNLNIGRTNADLGFGGLVLSAGNESVNLLLRALKQRSRIQVLSSPTIMTLDNLTGYVQVGSEVRFISGTTITNGIAQNQVDITQVGIILQVQPRLSPDGMIVMNVDVTKSNLGNDADGTTVGFAANGDPIRVPPINITTTQTSVMARHGQTVVFAGLITSSDTQEMRGVPILSDIPAIGRLFRFDSEQQLRTELMIILTPYVVESEADVATLNQMGFDRMSWCLSDVASIYGSIGYDDQAFMIENQPDVIYPDLSPTGEPTEAQPQGILMPGDAIPQNALPGGSGIPPQGFAPPSSRRDQSIMQERVQADFGGPQLQSPLTRQDGPWTMTPQGVRPVGWNGGNGQFTGAPIGTEYPPRVASRSEGPTPAPGYRPPYDGNDVAPTGFPTPAPNDSDGVVRDATGGTSGMWR